MRHPWLQINLLTAFAAAFVVSLFEDTIAQIVVLAAFLPVLAGQSGNTGCQSLAVTIRGLTLDELAAMGCADSAHPDQSFNMAYLAARTCGAINGGCHCCCTI